MSRIELRLQPDPALLRVMRMTLAAAARVHHLPESLAEDIRLAATEATAEAMAAHAYADIDDPILVALDITGRAVMVTVEHVGRPGRVPATASQSVDRLAVAAGIADGLEISSGPAGATRVELTWPTVVG